MKWQTHRVDTYVGLRPGRRVQVCQARERFCAPWRAQGASSSSSAEFVVRDFFRPVGSRTAMPAVKAVGFDRNIRDRWSGGGFDVVSTMFCLQYAIESEEKARCMRWP